VATPALLRPLDHGADIVVHSVSKSMTSSGFGIGGALVARHHITSHFGSDAMRENFAAYVKLLPGRDYGAALSPFNALMTLNDLRTLRSKMDILSQTAQQVAEFLQAHPNVDRVIYPGLPDTPEHEVAKKYMLLVDSADDYGQPVNRYGHLLAFEVRDGAQAARDVFDRFDLILRATDLGRIKSVATIPAISTHQQQGDKGRDLAGIAPNLIRLNVGAEHPDDIADSTRRWLCASGDFRLFALTVIRMRRLHPLSNVAERDEG
jgi:O-acetylhomoserine/O-acetylserine sulfhydrylase-like pyridoxal-dependent enzyme